MVHLPSQQGTVRYRHSSEAGLLSNHHLLLQEEIQLRGCWGQQHCITLRSVLVLYYCGTTSAIVSECWTNYPLSLGIEIVLVLATGRSGKAGCRSSCFLLIPPKDLLLLWTQDLHCLVWGKALYNWVPGLIAFPWRQYFPMLTVHSAGEMKMTAS